MAQTAPAPAGRDAFDAATAGLLFTKDFNSSLEAVMHDPQATTAQRVIAWTKRRAWGNYSLYCTLDTGAPAGQSDCAAELGLDKTRVSHTFKYYESRGLVRTEGRLIFPVTEPQPAENHQKVADSRNFSLFLAYWKVADSDNFQKLEVARSEVKRLKNVALSAYKQWRASATTAAPSLSETVETVETVNERTSEAAPQPEDTTSPSVPAPHPPAPPIKDQLRTYLTAKTDRFGLLTLPDATALRAIAAEIPDSGTFQRFCSQVEKQKPRPKTWKYFATIAKACAAAEAASNRLVDEERAAAAERIRAWENPEPAAQPEPEAPEPPPPTAEQLQRTAEQQADEAERKASARATTAARRQAETEARQWRAGRRQGALARTSPLRAERTRQQSPQAEEQKPWK